MTSEPLCLLTLYKDLGDFGVTGTESTIDFKSVCVVEERTSQWEKDFLSKRKEEDKFFLIVVYLYVLTKTWSKP